VASSMDHRTLGRIFVVRPIWVVHGTQLLQPFPFAQFLQCILLGRKLAAPSCSSHFHSQFARRGAFPRVNLLPTNLFTANFLGAKFHLAYISRHFLSPLNTPRIGYSDLERGRSRQRGRSSWWHWDPGDSTAAASRGRASFLVASTASIRRRPSMMRSSPGPMRRTGPWAATASSVSVFRAGSRAPSTSSAVARAPRRQG
jgi:hypothetical protein